MNDPDIQREFWDGAAASREFSHPLPLALLSGLIARAAKVLDYGCGYGRSCAELAAAGYRNLVGIDVSEEMIRRGKRLHAELDLRVFDGRSTGFADGSFDACLLIAVLNCLPSDPGQERAIAEIRRVLRPGGILFLSDYPLQRDERNQRRYREFEKELGAFGAFRSGGATFRHHDLQRLPRLLSAFDVVWERRCRVATMNGNELDAFQLAARKSDR